MKLFVPDASIILKWVLCEHEDNQDTALSLLHGWLNQECAFILPSLWMYEVGNVLGLKKPKEADELLGLLLDYEFPEARISKRLINQTYRLMKEHRGITFYDAVYHAVAVEESGTLVTADKAYFDKMHGKGGIVLI